MCHPRLPSATVLLATIALVGCGDGDGSGQPIALPDATHEQPAAEGGIDGTRPDVVSDVAVDEGPAFIKCTPDEDDDNIPDDVEGRSENRDTDDDGKADYLDTDSDDDSIPDLIEGNTSDVGCMTPLDSDGDNTPDYVDTDSDDNGIDDSDEVYPDGSRYSENHPRPTPAMPTTTDCPTTLTATTTVTISATRPSWAGSRRSIPTPTG